MGLWPQPSLPSFPDCQMVPTPSVKPDTRQAADSLTPPLALAAVGGTATVRGMQCFFT